MKLTIRGAVKSDYHSVEAIMQEVQLLHVQWRPDIYKPAEPVFSEEAYMSMVESGTCLVAEVDNEVVGICSYLYRHIQSDKQVTRDIIFVDDLAIKESCRGNGIGTALLQYLKNKVREEHLNGLELQVNAKNLQARAMYEKNGFTEKSINLELL